MRCVKCGAYDTPNLLCFSCVKKQPVILFETTKYTVTADENNITIKEIGNDNIMIMLTRNYIDTQIEKLIFPKFKVTISNDPENGSPSKFLRLINLIGLRLWNK